MGRKRSKSTGSPLGDFLGMMIIAMAELFIILAYLLYQLIFLIVNIIIFIKSGYKEKSGNGFFKTWFNKGLKGEYIVYRKACKLFSKENVLVNVYLPCSTEGIDNTEIDVVAVTNNSLYCIEVKNYKGYIYGKENDRTWTQVLNRRRKYTFYNPIKQNNGHIQAMKEYLNVEEKMIYPLIVFGNKANLENVRYCLSDSCYMKEVKTFLKKRNMTSDYIISEDDKNRFLKLLSEKSLVSDIIKETHIDQVQDVYNR